MIAKRAGPQRRGRRHVARHADRRDLGSRRQRLAQPVEELALLRVVGWLQLRQRDVHRDSRASVAGPGDGLEPAQARSTRLVARPSSTTEPAPAGRRRRSATGLRSADAAVASGPIRAGRTRAAARSRSRRGHRQAGADRRDQPRVDGRPELEQRAAEEPGGEDGDDDSGDAEIRRRLPANAHTAISTMNCVTTWRTEAPTPSATSLRDAGPATRRRAGRPG